MSTGSQKNLYRKTMTKQLHQKLSKDETSSAAMYCSVSSSSVPGS